jgi:hypothetical protein
MRYVLMFLTLAACAAVAEDQPYDIQLACAGTDIVVQVAMAKPGMLTFKVPHNACGTDI